MIIERAEQKDLPEIVGIYNQTVPTRMATADLNPRSVESFQAWFDAHKDSRPLYVLKNTEQQILAWGSFSDYYPREAYHISVEVSIYVSSSAQGKGLGRAFLKFMLGEAPSLGVQNVLAVIFGHNKHSITLFETEGFSQWGRLPAVCGLDGKLADIVILGKKL